MLKTRKVCVRIWSGPFFADYLYDYGLFFYLFATDQILLIV